MQKKLVFNDFSNYPKDINLEEDDISEEDAFLRPKIADPCSF